MISSDSCLQLDRGNSATKCYAVLAGLEASQNP